MLLQSPIERGMSLGKWFTLASNTGYTVKTLRISELPKRALCYALLDHRDTLHLLLAHSSAAPVLELRELARHAVRARLPRCRLGRKLVSYQIITTAQIIEEQDKK